MDFSYPIRPVAASELAAFGTVPDQAFNSNWPSEEILNLDRLVFEPDRSLAAFDGSQPVGTTVAYSFGMTVPGGLVPAAGVSMVAVLPSHRRRGILSALMKRQLTDIAAGNEPVATLFASEAPIYGRFGYGAAVEHYGFKLQRGEGQLRPLPADPRGTPVLRLAEPKAALPQMRAVYDAIAPTRPGMLAIGDNWWDLSTEDPEFMREGSSPMRCMIAEDELGPRGYALYSVKPEWGSDHLPDQRLHVRGLFWTDPAACASLWSDLLSRDLVTHVSARSRAADDLLPYLLADSRRARPSRADGLWVRLVDLPTALRMRRYSSAVDVVIEVTDDQLPANAGRWRLRAGGRAEPAEPTCDRSTAGADLTMPVSALGAAYLGGARLGALAEVGEIIEHRPDAVAALSTAMWWDPAPWSPIGF